MVIEADYVIICGYYNFSGGDGPDGVHGEPGAMGENGGDGGSGGNLVITARRIDIGDLHFVSHGGKGGKGGNGGVIDHDLNSPCDEYPEPGGHGGNGGKGGNTGGIILNACEVNFLGELTIDARPGAGGDGGTGGSVIWSQGPMPGKGIPGDGGDGGDAGRYFFDYESPAPVEGGEGGSGGIAILSCLGPPPWGGEHVHYYGDSGNDGADPARCCPMVGSSPLPPGMCHPCCPMDPADFELLVHDTCADAVEIESVCGTQFVGTLAGHGDNFETLLCGYRPFRVDRMWKFSIPQGMPTDLVIEAALWDEPGHAMGAGHSIAIATDCPPVNETEFLPIACDSIDGPGTTRLVVSLEEDQTYYVLLEAQNPYTQYHLTFECDPSPFLENDAPCDAKPIECDYETAGFLTTFASVSSVSTNCMGSQPDAWYKFTAPKAGMTIEATFQHGSSSGSVSIFAGECDDLTEENCGISLSSSPATASYVTSTPGEEVYVRIAASHIYSELPYQELSVTCRAPNDERVDATVINCGYSEVGPITIYATETDDPTPPSNVYCQQQTGLKDVWYKISTPTGYPDPVANESVGPSLTIAFDDGLAAPASGYWAFYKRNPNGSLSLVDINCNRPSGGETGFVTRTIKCGSSETYYIRLATNSTATDQSFSVSCFSKLE